MADKKKYYIKVQGKPVDVTEEIYKFNNSSKRQGRTQKARDKRYGLLSIQGFDTDTVNGEELICDRHAESVEDRAIALIMSEHLHACIDLLPPADRELINALYFDGKSERALSAETGMPQKTINNHRKGALRRLKKF